MPPPGDSVNPGAFADGVSPAELLVMPIRRDDALPELSDELTEFAASFRRDMTCVAERRTGMAMARDDLPLAPECAPEVLDTVRGVVPSSDALSAAALPGEVIVDASVSVPSSAELYGN